MRYHILGILINAAAGASAIFVYGLTADPQAAFLAAVGAALCVGVGALCAIGTQ